MLKHQSLKHFDTVVKERRWRLELPLTQYRLPFAKYNRIRTSRGYVEADADFAFFSFAFFPSGA
jgi:hypothetical protein